jgi:hypothetical protein
VWSLSLAVSATGCSTVTRHGADGHRRRKFDR